MGKNYDYDEKAASHADDFVNRIDQSGHFIGQFKRAEAIEAGTGTFGVRFEFEAPGGGSARFDIYTERANGDKLQGYNQLQAMQTILGLRGLRCAPGKVMKYDNDEKMMMEADGEIYPDLLGKNIGVVLQREDYTGNNGKDGWRLGLVGVFHAESRLTASEIRERKTEPLKLARIIRGLKNKDTRVKSQEPAQPSAGAPAGDY